MDNMKASLTLDILIANRIMGENGRVYVGRPYSRSIEAAWMVVEKLKARGLSIACNNHGSSWQVEIIEGPVVFADTFPEAICNAALLVAAPGDGATRRDGA